MPDHVVFTGPVSEPISCLAYFAALEPNLVYGTGVYLLPLRHPAPTAKAIATLDRLIGAGRLIFGVGVGGEFPREFEASGVPVRERGGRTNEAIEVLKLLWTGERVEYHGQYFSFGPVTMLPKPATPGGPPIWIGGKSPAAIRRAARLGDGWMPYVITPERYAEGLESIAREADRAGRRLESFGTSVHLFARLADSYEDAIETAAVLLGKRYATDFHEGARKYAVAGRPADVAAQISRYVAAGARDIGIDMVSRRGEREDQFDQFAREVMPLLR